MNDVQSFMSVVRLACLPPIPADALITIGRFASLADEHVGLIRYSMTADCTSHLQKIYFYHKNSR
jgi:hypothetical protein